MADNICNYCSKTLEGEPQNKLIAAGEKEFSNPLCFCSLSCLNKRLIAMTKSSDEFSEDWQDAWKLVARKLAEEKEAESKSLKEYTFPRTKFVITEVEEEGNNMKRVNKASH